METVLFRDIGLIDFQEAWDLQEGVLQKLVDRKTKLRKDPDLDLPVPQHQLIFCEHPHVYTLGKSGAQNNLLINDNFLKSINATYYKINRGGDITYHGPGQIVAYPILDLDHFFNDIHKYMRYLEEVIILTLADYGLIGSRIKGLTGVWIDADKTGKERKICAFGVRCSRWVTMHGLAFNVNTDLNYFNHIVPCGIQDKAVTSLQKELGRKIDLFDVQSKMKQHFSNVFPFKLQEEVEVSK
ncbi:MAG: lipoyl(octanoyl) transferase LipB [Bacteroidia bacterium]|nr:lipoyl(octanoyl) transferase LipB [Bacteroidia bacterium]